MSVAGITGGGRSTWGAGAGAGTDLREPPMSLPQPRGEPSMARSAASPPVLPPHVYEREYGFSERPQTGFVHSKKKMHCATFVFVNGMPPALRTSATTCSSPPGREGEKAMKGGMGDESQRTVRGAEHNVESTGAGQR